MKDKSQFFVIFKELTYKKGTSLFASASVYGQQKYFTLSKRGNWYLWYISSD